MDARFRQLREGGWAQTLAAGDQRVPDGTPPLPESAWSPHGVAAGHDRLEPQPQPHNGADALDWLCANAQKLSRLPRIEIVLGRGLLESLAVIRENLPASACTARPTIVVRMPHDEDLSMHMADQLETLVRGLPPRVETLSLIDLALDPGLVAWIAGLIEQPDVYAPAAIDLSQNPFGPYLAEFPAMMMPLPRVQRVDLSLCGLQLDQLRRVGCPQGVQDLTLSGNILGHDCDSDTPIFATPPTSIMLSECDVDCRTLVRALQLFEGVLVVDLGAHSLETDLEGQAFDGPFELSEIMDDAASPGPMTHGQLLSEIVEALRTDGTVVVDPGPPTAVHETVTLLRPEPLVGAAALNRCLETTHQAGAIIAALGCVDTNLWDVQTLRLPLTSKWNIRNDGGRCAQAVVDAIVMECPDLEQIRIEGELTGPMHFPPGLQQLDLRTASGIGRLERIPEGCQVIVSPTADIGALAAYATVLRAA